MKFIRKLIKYFSVSNYRTMSLLMGVLIIALFINSQISSSTTSQRISSETFSYGSISDCQNQCLGGCVLDSKNPGQYICQGTEIGGPNGNPANGVSCSTCAVVSMRYLCSKNGSTSCSTADTGACQDCGAGSNNPGGGIKNPGIGENPGFGVVDPGRNGDGGSNGGGNSGGGNSGSNDQVSCAICKGQNLKYACKTDQGNTICSDKNNGNSCQDCSSVVVTPSPANGVPTPSGSSPAPSPSGAPAGVCGTCGPASNALYYECYQGGRLALCGAKDNYSGYTCYTCQSGHLVTPTPTSAPTPSQGNNPNPTAAETPKAGEAVLNLSIKIPGIGSAEAGENSVPKHRERDFVVQLFDKDDKMVKQTNARLNFDGNLFKGTAKIPDVTNGNYVVKVKSNNSLFKAAPGVVNIQEGETVQIPQLTLVSGNVNDSAESKNNLNALDYNSVISYFGKSVNDVDGELADLNDDGVVNEKDINILLRGFVIRKGD